VETSHGEGQSHSEVFIHYFTSLKSRVVEVNHTQRFSS